MNTVDLIRLKNLRLAARVVSDRLLAGTHQSRRAGPGAEFEQYRPYFPGDDLRRIDWKLYARSGRYQVRESAAESHLQIGLVLDLSGSMNYSENGISRLEYGKILLGSLAYMGYRQSDPMRLYTVQEGGLEYRVPEGKNAFYRILYHLEKAEAYGPGIGQQQHFPTLLQKKKELLILVSDLLQESNEWVQLVKELASPYRQILIFQVLGRRELDFDFTGFYRFKDLETGAYRELEAGSVRKKFSASFGAYLGTLDQELSLPDVHLVRTSLDTPPARALSEALNVIRRWNS